MVQKPQSGAEGKERRIDLSLPQVAGSAVAAVAAAVMASQLGVYGTIAGAGVMSVVATCGGSVFQHFFRRTGEQIREVTVQVKHPAGRQVTVHTRETVPGPQRPEDDATRVLRTVGPDADRTTVLRQVRPGEAGPGGAYPGGPALGDPSPDGPRPGDALTDGSYSDARTHGTRVRGWKRSALAATGVFVLSMAGITVYETVSGHDLGGNGGTTIGTVVSGERHGGTTSPSPSPSDSTGQEDEGDQGDDGNAPGSGSSTSPGTGRGDGGSAQPDPSGGGGTATDPAPTPSASGGATTPEATTPTEPGDSGTTPAAPDPTGADEVPDQQGGDTAGSDTDR
ncbi:hypothetical protein OG379_28820 [Streptomyces sp. NBC_01166]|uniref:hypothetical protein n=1 Tax=Streptomyces sp. NBC_01166 TaxID=2903755 RepID=UPI0038630F8F|nr:hypothetical protein OG379_28820 [Streptomyces sp. NBC_01166]